MLLLGHLMDQLPVLPVLHLGQLLVLDQRVQINHLLGHLHRRLELVLHLEVVRHLEEVVLPHLLGLRS